MQKARINKIIMNVVDFNSKYKEKGGMDELSKLRSLLFTRKYIASHFGVTNDRVRQWMIIFFGSDGYDSRPERKEAIMESMVDFARSNNVLDFKLAFRGNEYFKETLSKCKELGIYDNV